jgi:uncharacterized protein (TIGR00369 family)
MQAIRGGVNADDPGPSGADLARGWFEHSPFVALLGLRLESVEPDRALVAMPFRAELATAGDLVHGGAIASLLDTAAAVAAWSAHDPAAGTRWGTVSMAVSFLAGGRGGTLHAAATVSRRGRSVCHCRVEISDAEWNTIAEGMVVYRLGA